MLSPGCVPVRSFGIDADHDPVQVERYADSVVQPRILPGSRAAEAAVDEAGRCWVRRARGFEQGDKSLIGFDAVTLDKRVAQNQEPDLSERLRLWNFLISQSNRIGLKGVLEIQVDSRFEEVGWMSEESWILGRKSC